MVCGRVRCLKRWINDTLSIKSSRICRGGYSSMKSSTASLVDPEKKSFPCDVAKGFIPVYVGDAKQRFVVPIGYLSFESIKALLVMCEEEYGYEYHGAYSGGLKLPCDVGRFESAVEQAEEFFKASRKDQQEFRILFRF